MSHVTLMLASPSNLFSTVTMTPERQWMPLEDQRLPP